MHMSDALISPQVSAAMWVASLGTAAYSIRVLKNQETEPPAALAGVLGAFVFAAQMINFSIPGTGSSGHLGGALLLSILLGPHLAFLCMAAILLIQALFFADGGILAYGCNVFNLGFYTCFIAYPYVYVPLAERNTKGSTLWAAVLAGILGLQMGAFSVVIQTILSGKTEIPFSLFTMLMQPIHLAIGLVEGLVTASIVAYILKTERTLLQRGTTASPTYNSLGRLTTVFAILALFTGGFFSWFASENPDGLEWALEHATGSTELGADSKIHRLFASVQDATALLPDYSLPSQYTEPYTSSLATYGGTSIAGILGAGISFLFVLIVSNIIRRKVKAHRS
ncbi:MAG: energy-coupling factor ABC transporter permease [Termitinemataceae bacterium]